MRLDTLKRFFRRDPERARQAGDCLLDAAGVRAPAYDRVAPIDRLAHHVAKRLIGGDHLRGAERAAKPAVRIRSAFEQRLERQVFQKLHLRGLVEHGEAGGDVRFEWKLMQQLRAEGVNRLHLQAPRRVERAREQPPRQRAARARNPRRLLANGGIERVVVERGPAPERIEHALRHIGGGGFGEGEAEDFFRRHAVEQEVDHPLRQHMGLARSGIGGDPRRNPRIGHLALQAQHVGWNDARRSHVL